MTHEITHTDNVLLHTVPAWHGLGDVVRKDRTPRQALTDCGLEWGVEAQPLFRKLPDGRFVEVPTHVANIRGDVKMDDQLLGVVGSGYKPVQNADLADFAEALANEDSRVTVETCGSIRGGRKVWFLVRGEAFTVGRGDDDVVHPYLCVSNAHDGSSSVRVTPTSVRVVCSNTLHMVIPEATEDGRSRLTPAAISFTHKGDIAEKVIEAKDALAQFGQARDHTRQVADMLAGKHIRPAALEEFFYAMYGTDHGWTMPVANPKTKTEKAMADKAKDRYEKFQARFDKELDVAGASWWNAVNAFTGMVQHDLAARGKDDTARRDTRVMSSLFGTNSERSSKALQTAFQLAG